MVTLPAPYTATRYPGYFWNVETQKLYSIKIAGELREMRLQPGNFWNKWNPGYRISHKGNSGYLRVDILQRLEIVDSEIGVVDKKENNL